MDRFRIRLLLIACLVYAGESVRGQDSLLIDSLNHELEMAESDSLRVFWLNRLTWNTIVNNTQQAQGFNIRARELSRKIGDEMGVARTFHYAGMIDRFEGNYTEAIENLNQALAYYDSVKFDVGIAGALFNLGVVYSEIGDYEKSLAVYYRQLEMNEAMGDEFQVGNTLNSIGSVHRKMGNYEEALDKYSAAQKILEKFDRVWNLTNVISNIGALYMDMEQYEKAAPLFRQALNNNLQSNDTWGVGYSYHWLGQLKQVQNQLDSAEYYMQKAVEIRRGLDQKLEYAESLAALGAIWFDQNRTDKAIEILLEGLHLSKEIGALEAQSNAHNLLAQIYHDTEQSEKAYDHLRAYSALRDSTVNEEKQRITRNLEARYESAKKDKALVEREMQIASKEARIHRQDRTIYIGIGVMVALIIVFGSIVMVYRSRRKLNEQKLQNLQKEKELVALKSMMIGEEKERARIARELHDGLSSFLAAIKIQFSSLQKNSTVYQEDEKFNRAMQQLDEANTEVRRIAHNMMPEILMKYGMEVALAEFIGGLNTSDSIRVEFSPFGMKERLPSSVELVLYRVVQELLSNVIKHSKATEVLVQLNRRSHHLSITVEDNGIGFEDSALTDSDGIGIQNLSSRIQYLNGNLNFESSRETGTSVYIDLDLDKIPEEI